MEEKVVDDIIMDDHDKVEQVVLGRTMKTSFLNYAMSVIVSRALPDVKDGLKPVQRRILYGMNELHIYANSAFKKSARIVGDVMGKYHPHGDSSIYEAMVRMAQPFSYRYMLVDGHGNFGSVDGDGAAAMRYTEARMSKISMELLKDLDKNTVDFIDNYDATEKEPMVLPSKYPNLLVNGATGIAVGMATNIPPHNLGEVIDATIALMENSELSELDLMDYIKGPDFPTGGIILGLTGLRNAYTTGNGLIVVRAKAEIQEPKGNKGSSIIITEIPYMVNKTRLIERIAEVVKEKIVDGITDLRDESNRKGMRIVIETRRDCNAEVLLNNLYKYTQLQTSVGINMIALVDNKPITLTIKTALVEYIKHQMNVLTRRTLFDLDKAKARMHILEGLMIAGDNIDEIINIIRNNKEGNEKEELINRFSLTEIQAQAILDMQLKRLSGINREKTIEEYKNLEKNVIEYNSILESDEKKHDIIKGELLEVKNKYNDERKSEISLHTDLNIENEDLIPREDVVITITQNGYAKRMRQDVYKNQSRGGVGVAGIKTNESDEVAHILPMCTHDYILFFTNKGRVYSKKGYQIPEGTRISKGLPIVNIINLVEDEKLAAIAKIENFDCADSCLFFVTKNGIIKRTLVSQFRNIRVTGINAINLTDDDELLQVEITDGKREIILGASNGKAIRFNEESIRTIGRNAMGVRGMKINKDDKLVGMAVITEENKDILVITEKGYGKRSDISEYRLQGRGGMGVKTLNVTNKNGKLASLRAVNDNQDIIITTDKGMVIRTSIAEISQTGRSTQGVKVIRLKDDQVVSTVAIVSKEEDDTTSTTEEAVVVTN